MLVPFYPDLTLKTRIGIVIIIGIQNAKLFVIVFCEPRNPWKRGNKSQVQFLKW